MPAQPTFNPLPSALAFGPPTDLSMGWDGTLWGIDASGAPHLYDPSTNAWQLHGQGIDAAASSTGASYFFRGNQVLQINAASGAATLATIAEAFPKVPDSFKLGVSGAAFSNTKLLLFKGGRYVLADGSSAPQQLTDIDNWPKTPVWQDGLITAVYADDYKIWLFNGAEYVEVVGWEFPGGPGAIATGKTSDLFNWGRVLPAAWLSSGFDAGISTATGFILFNGAAVAQFDGSAAASITPTYVSKAYPAWPATWNPMLNQAPSGRVGNLWAVDTAQNVFQHDGVQWIQRFGKVQQVSVGQDGAVYHISANAVDLYKWDGKEGWAHQATSAVPLAQIALGDETHIWVRDNNNQAHRYSNQDHTFTAVDLGAGVPNPTHMAATSDGTLWHCNNSNADAFRFISGETTASAAIPVRQGSVTGVQKVAGTGFGAAHCLVTAGDGSAQVYSYESPYLFKTATNYRMLGDSGVTGAQFAQGLGNLYFVQFVSSPASGYQIVRFVALNAHTGREVAGSAPLDGQTTYTGMVFDPLNDLVYVGTSPMADLDQTTAGQLMALDAHTLAVKWTFTADAGIDAVPTLNGTQLCFGDRQGKLYAIDTRAASAGAPAAPTVQWKITLPVTQAQTHRVTTPLYTNGLIYVAFWDVNVQCDACLGPTVLSWVFCRPDGTNLSPIYQLLPQPVTTVLPGMLQSPVVGQATFNNVLQPCLFINGTSEVYAALLVNPDPDNLNTFKQFTLPSGTVVTGFTYDDGSRAGGGLAGSSQPSASTRLWFGDSNGNLWGLDQNMSPADGAPVRVDKRDTLKLTLSTTPVLYKDPKGGLTVLFGVFDSTGTLPSALWGYDPTNHNVASIPAGITYLNVLSPTVTNGIIWAGGIVAVTGGSLPSQVFGIRVDELPQALRDFIIESQLMQDPDPTAQGGSSNPTNPIPPSVARYQTHLTVVDDQKNPQPYEPVKIWADKPDSQITVDGRPFTIGPGDAEFASVTTGPDGSLVIVSDATDMFASPLRVWATFMDPYERIVVYPDQEFHARVTTAHASSGDDDPDKVNLQTAHNYNGASLFTDQEKSQGQPQNCADAVGLMNKGVGLSGGASQAKFATVMQAIIGHGATGQVDDPSQPDKYLAYADLTGASHFPTNIPAARPANVAAPMGLHFARPQDDKSSPPALTAIHQADALAAIDELPSTKPDAPWLKPSLDAQGAKSRLIVGDDVFTDFWNWLRGA
ncbi:MAG: hypothetical protein NW701_16850, partial [Nitrospira sp.]